MPLISCPECGREKVSTLAAACPDCAFPIKESLYKSDDSLWETCEIGWDQYRNPLKALTARGTHVFFARAVSPDDGIYVADQSGRFGLDWRYSDTSNGYLNVDPDGRDPNATRALQELAAKLVAAGWEPTETRGLAWYSLRFRRKLSTKYEHSLRDPEETDAESEGVPDDRPITVGDLLELEEDTWLYGGKGSPEPEKVVMLLSSGTLVRVLKIGDRWVRVKTDDGDIGFVLEDRPEV